MKPTLALFSFITVSLLVFQSNVFGQVQVNPNIKPNLPQINIPECERISGFLIPFGAGDRKLTTIIKPCNISQTNMEVWVFYSENGGQLSNVQIGMTAPHGRAKYAKTENSNYQFDFILPHSYNKQPNSVDNNPLRIHSLKKVFFKVVWKSGSQQLTSDLFSFKMPQKLTIANVGDSYGAGEGAPVNPGPPKPQKDTPQLWDDGDDETTTDIPCHRSKTSGQTMAVVDLMDNHPELAIAFKNVACSGAVIENLWSSSTSDRQATHSATIPFQLDDVRTWLQNNNYDRLDILIMSIGGNNTGFADIVFDFLIVPLMDFHNDTEAQQDLATAIAQLHDDYDNLDVVIRNQLPIAGYPGHKAIILTGYPSPIQDKNGNPCGDLLKLSTYGLCWGPVELDDPVAEFQSIHDKFVVPMNLAMQLSAQRNSWEFLPMLDAAARHGLCNCSDGYVSTIGQADKIQGDVLGTVHPNNKGHDKMYKPQLASVLEAKVKYVRDLFHLGRLLNEDGRAKKEEEIVQYTLKLKLGYQLKYTALLNNIAARPLYYKSQKLQKAKAQRSTAKVEFLKSFKPAETGILQYQIPPKYKSFKLINEK